MYGTRTMGMVLAMTVGLAATAAAAPIIGQIDTFEDGTTGGWTVGGVHPAPPVNVGTGGPAGTDDGYLQVTSIGGGGPGSRLSAFNTTQWAGDYLAAGITAITMDLRNTGANDVVLRLLVAGPFGAMGPLNAAVTSDSAVLLAGGDWASYRFSLVASDLVPLFGSVDTALSEAGELRFFHNPDPFFGGPPASSPPVAAVIGLDNIRAVPEPATWLLVGLATAWGARRRRIGQGSRT